MHHEVNEYIYGYRRGYSADVLSEKLDHPPRLRCSERIARNTESLPTRHGTETAITANTVRFSCKNSSYYYLNTLDTQVHLKIIYVKKLKIISLSSIPFSIPRVARDVSVDVEAFIPQDLTKPDPLSMIKV